jgi:hypothetical protein
MLRGQQPPAPVVNRWSQTFSVRLDACAADAETETAKATVITTAAATVRAPTNPPPEPATSYVTSGLA